jgi:hypothetical protein
MIQQKQFSLKTDKKKFKVFLKTLSDLNKLGESIKIKIVKDEILLYSFLTVKTHILCLKCTFHDLSDICNTSDDGIIDYIILNPRLLLRSGMLFLEDKFSEDITITFTYQEGTIHASNINITNDKMDLDLNFIGGNKVSVKDIPKSIILEKMEPTLALYSFDITSSHFDDIKKLSSISDEEIVSIIIKKNKVSFGNKRWKLKVCDNLLVPDNTITFKKKHFNLITAESIITINVFETYIVIIQNKNYLLIGLEVSEL